MAHFNLCDQLHLHMQPGVYTPDTHTLTELPHFAPAC
jgi:hypothetical protein